MNKHNLYNKNMFNMDDKINFHIIKFIYLQEKNYVIILFNTHLKCTTCIIDLIDYLFFPASAFAIAILWAASC